MTGVRRSTILVLTLCLLMRQPLNHPFVTSSQHSDCITTSAVKTHPPSSYAQTQPLQTQPKTSATAQRTTRSTLRTSGSRVLPFPVLQSRRNNQMNVCSSSCLITPRWSTPLGIHPQTCGLVQAPHFNMLLDPKSKHSFTRLSHLIRFPVNLIIPIHIEFLLKLPSFSCLLISVIQLNPFKFINKPTTCYSPDCGPRSVIHNLFCIFLLISSLQ